MFQQKPTHIFKWIKVAALSSAAMVWASAMHFSPLQGGKANKLPAPKSLA